MALLKRDDGASYDVKALLGAGTEFEGTLAFEGAVRIDGRLSGTIRDGDVLIVGEGAAVFAEITCGSVVVCGEVTGNIHARDSVELRQQGRVRGDIDTRSLLVERGAVFEGHMKVEAMAPGASPTCELPTSRDGSSASLPLAAVNG